MIRNDLNLILTLFSFSSLRLFPDLSSGSLLSPSSSLSFFCSRALLLRNSTYLINIPRLLLAPDGVGDDLEL